MIFKLSSPNTPLPFHFLHIHFVFPVRLDEIVSQPKYLLTCYKISLSLSLSLLFYFLYQNFTERELEISNRFLSIVVPLGQTKVVYVFHSSLLIYMHMKLSNLLCDILVYSRPCVDGVIFTNISNTIQIL